MCAFVYGTLIHKFEIRIYCFLNSIYCLQIFSAFIRLLLVGSRREYGPLGNLGFPNFPYFTEIDSSNFGYAKTWTRTLDLAMQKHGREEPRPRSRALQVICGQHTLFTSMIFTSRKTYAKHPSFSHTKLCEENFRNKRNKFYEEQFENS